MITIRLAGHPAAPLACAFGENEEGIIELLLFGDVKSGIQVEVVLSEENRRALRNALDGKPIIQTAKSMPPGMAGG